MKRPEDRQATGGDEMFKVGDTVMLKSGGPEMTVTNTDDPGGALTCAWFTGDFVECRCAVFPFAALGLIDEDDDPGEVVAEAGRKDHKKAT